ncbi:MAG TPA: alpha-L-rhamnosidase C-terminal domain-containing protein [Lunatimonas sp.]|nr:alpha-L-rhamnosidase C-terminal domain-containing protein [Lunatimonas sp.]
MGLLEIFFTNGGIQIHDEAPGFKEIVIRPLFSSDLHWVEAGYNSPYGWIESHWKKNGENIVLELEVPANSQAEVRLPATMVSRLTLNGKETSMTKHSDKAGTYMALVLDSGSHTLEF